MEHVEGQIRPGHVCNTYVRRWSRESASFVHNWIVGCLRGMVRKKS